MGRGYLKGGKQLEFGEEWGKRKKVERRQFKKNTIEGDLKRY